MNLLDWDAIRALQGNLSSNHQNVNNSMVKAPGTNSEWDIYCKYVRNTVDEAQSGMGVDVGWKEPGPPSHNFHIKNSEVEDPDGERLEVDEEDPELTRKRQELREIEERIIYKKASIALKAVEPFVKETTFPDISCSEQSPTCKGATLKDRVNILLQQRHPASFLSKFHSPKERMNSSSLVKDGLLQDEHPLKLRVKALMKKRCSDPFDLPASREVLDITLHPPSQSVTSPAKEDYGVDKGFQRFLSVLNKGVDMDFLSKIVNDDSADLPLDVELPNIQPPAVENKSDSRFRRERQQSSSGPSLPGHSGSNSRERKTDPTSRGRSHNDRLSLPDNDEKKNGIRDCSFGSSSHSKSPSPVKVKKKKKEEDKPKVDKQHEQLKSILKTLGLSLEVEEMSKLADRTQERLYGKKHENTEADSRGEQEADSRGEQEADSRGEQEAGPRSGQRRYTYSSSSSSSSSGSCSPSPRRWSSRSRESSRRSERSHSRGRRRDELTCQDGNQDSKDAYRDTYEDRKYPEEISAYQHPYPQNHTYPHPYPAAHSAFPDYSVYQDPQYNNYHSGDYSATTNSYWAPPQSAHPPSYYPSGCPYPEDTYHHFPGSIAAPNMVYPHNKPKYNSVDFNLIMNPDLSKSEGQVGSVSGLRCLQVVTTKQPTKERCLQRLTNCMQKRGKLENRIKHRRLRWKRKKELRKQKKLAARQSACLEELPEPQQLDKEDSEGQQSKEEKRPPTEEEIKANLRKTLEAFNRKVKEKVVQTSANSLTSQIG